MWHRLSLSLFFSMLWGYSSLFAKIEIYRGDVETLFYYQEILGSQVVDCDLEKLKKGKVSKKTNYIFMNLPHQFRKYPLKKMADAQMTLFMWEPPMWQKKMYSTKIHKYFSKIYTWNDDLVDNETYFKFYYPVKKPMIENLPSFHEKYLVTMIIGYKDPKYHNRPYELYSERERAIRYFEAVEPTFSFYGYGWNPAEYRSYGGPLEGKVATNQQYKFTICYENSILPGYITEKIFDCFAAGSVPVYWGASNVTHYIPENCFIDRRKFTSYAELHSFLQNMTEDMYNNYLQNIRDYLSSKESECFSKEYFSELFKLAS